MPTATRRLNFVNPHASYDRYHPRHRYDIQPINQDECRHSPHGWTWQLWDALEQRFVGPTFQGRINARRYKQKLVQRYERGFDF